MLVKPRARSSTPKKTATILERLSTPALPVEETTRDKFRSSFFFKLRGETEEDLRRKALTEKPEIPSSVRELEKRADLYKKELPRSMEARIDRVREYLLSEINPLVLSLLAGSEQAFDVLGRATESDVEKEMHRQLQTMLERGVKLKLSRFVAKYLGLTAKDAATLLERNPPTSIVFPRLQDIKPEHPIGDKHEQQNRK